MKMNFKLSLRTESLLTDKSGGITKAPVVLYKYVNKYTIIIFKMRNNSASQVYAQVCACNRAPFLAKRSLYIF